MKNIFVITLIIICGKISAQEMIRFPQVVGIEVSYTNESVMVAINNESQYKSAVVVETKKMANLFPQETIYIDYKAKKVSKTAAFADGERFTNISRFKYSKKFKIIGEESLGGWDCKIAETTSKGNTYKIWYTTNTGYQGTPMPEIGVVEGLVFKITCNDKTVIEIFAARQITNNCEIERETPGQCIGGKEYVKRLTRINHQKPVELQ